MGNDKKDLPPRLFNGIKYPHKHICRYVLYIKVTPSSATGLEAGRFGLKQRPISYARLSMWLDYSSSISTPRCDRISVFRCVTIDMSNRGVTSCIDNDDHAMAKE